MNLTNSGSKADARFPHACERLNAVLAETGGTIRYWPQFREYVLQSGVGEHPLEWCPFCGTILPLSLRETHAAWLSEAKSKADSTMLAKLETDEWWRRVIRDGEVDITDRPSRLSWGQPNPIRNKRRVFAVLRVQRVEQIERLDEVALDDDGLQDIYGRIIEQIRVYDDLDTAESEVKRLNEVNVVPELCVYIWSWAYLHAEGGAVD